MTNIVQWSDIKHNFTDTLLVGNGGSIAFSEKFNYDNLYEYAINEKLLNDKHKDIFNKLMKGKDFERLMYRLWQADYVNERFDVIDDERKKVRKAYTDIRRCLINSVIGIHPAHQEISIKTIYAGSFLSNFLTVFSLKYDLTIYWSALAFNYQNHNAIKDGFTEAISSSAAKRTKTYKFVKNIDKLRTPYGQNKNATLLFFPHGNIMLYHTRSRQEEKKIATSGDKTLLETLTNYWSSNDGAPIFVSEGISLSKLRTIQSSEYLSYVYYEELPRPSESLVIYGWSIGENDNHILEQLKKANYNRIAVSIRQSDDIEKKINDYRKKLKDVSENIIFFDAESRGCWCHE